MKLLAGLTTLMMIIMSVAFLVSFNQNIKHYEAIKNADRVMVCYDDNGRATQSDDWKECKLERIFRAFIATEYKRKCK